MKIKLPFALRSTLERERRKVSALENELATERANLRQSERRQSELREGRDKHAQEAENLRFQLTEAETQLKEANSRIQSLDAHSREMARKMAKARAVLSDAIFRNPRGQFSTKWKPFEYREIMGLVDDAAAEA